MQKKIIPFVFAAIAVMLPTTPAAAWEQVCMKLPFGKAWFAGYLVVAHGFDTEIGLPTLYRIEGKEFHSGWLPQLGGSGEENIADGKVASGRIFTSQSKCVDISGVSNGTPFIVYVATADTGDGDPSDTPAALCETHPSNPDQWYLQTTRPFRTLWYDAWGAAWAPRCKFVYESN